MAYIQSSTPLDDNKETTGTSGQLTTPALNSSAGDANTTTNAATPPAQSSNFIQPTASAAQQGTGFTNMQTYLDKNQGAAQHLTGNLNTALDTANNTASAAVNAANSKPTSGNLQTAASAVNNSISKSTLAQDVGGRTQLLRNMSPTTISNSGLGLDQMLVQQNFASGKVPQYNINGPGNTAAPVINTGPSFTPDATNFNPVKQAPASRVYAQPMQPDYMYKNENAGMIRQLAQQKAGGPAIFNPMAEVTPQGVNYQAGWGVNQAANNDMIRTQQANSQPAQQPTGIGNFNAAQYGNMYNVNAAMARVPVQNMANNAGALNVASMQQAIPQQNFTNASMQQVAPQFNAGNANMQANHIVTPVARPNLYNAGYDPMTNGNAAALARLAQTYK